MASVAPDEQWTEALHDLSRGRQVLLQRHGMLVAELTEPPPDPPLYYGVFKGRMWIAEDFDDPLPEFDESDDEDWT